MSLAYPVARTLEEAITPGVKAARSRSEATALSAGLTVEGLETSWLHLAPDQADALFRSLGAEGAAGHIQRYEDTSGHAVVAVSWWKLVDPDAGRAPAVRPFEPARPPSLQEDHTDDLYFRRGRTKNRRKKPADPNQLDLFSKRSEG